jgi:hypothetical protein
MKKLAFSVATAGTFAAITLGLAGPATAAPATLNHDAVYSTHSHPATIRPVDCSVHVNYQGSDVNVNWC